MTCGADRIVPAFVQREHLLKPDVVLPPVAKVILVEEALAFAQPEVSEAHVAGIVGEDNPPVVVDAVRLPVDQELLQVQVLPAHGNLHHVVELGNGRVTAHQQAAPYQGATVSQRDLELIDPDADCLPRGVLHARAHTASALRDPTL